MQEFNSPVGIAFYLNDTLLENSNLLTIQPSALLIYDQIEERIVSKYYKKSDDRYQYDSSYFAITSLFSETDIIDIMNLNFLNSKEILAFVDLRKINKSLYVSDLQVVIEKKLNDQVYIQNGGKVTSGCKEADPGCSYNDEGYCIPQEKQNGPASYICLPKEPCVANTEPTQSTLEEAETGSSGTANPKLYEIRDNVFSKSFNGKKYIDDYYYCSMILKESPITLEMAVIAISILRTNFLEIAANLKNENYFQEIPINQQKKELLINLCEKSKMINNDSRYLNIISKIEDDINFYENKYNIEIKNDF